jgi:MFS family permease
MIVNTVVVYASIFCFTFISSSYFQDRFGFTSIEAGFIISITFFVSIACCPISGILADKYGKRGLQLMISSILVFVTHVLFAITPGSHKNLVPIFYLIMLGIGFAIYSTVFWSGIAYIIPKGLLGTGFGLAFAFSNHGLIVGPLVVGYLKEHTEKDKGYFWVSVFLGAFAAVGVISSVILYVMDMAGLQKLDMVHSADENHEKLEKENESTPLLKLVI